MSERVFGTVNDGEVEFVFYKPEYMDGFMNVLLNSYYVGECLVTGLGINQPEHRKARDEVTTYCVNTLDEGISIVARVAATKQIVGHVVNTLQVQDKSGGVSAFEEYLNEHLREAASRECMRVVMEMDAMVDMFAANQTDVLMEVMFLSVDTAFARRSIGLTLVEYSLQLARELKAGQHQERLPAEKRDAARRVGGATALYASNYSKAIGDRLGFVVHAEKFYDQMEFEGKRLQDRIPDPLQRSMKLMSLRI